MRRKKFNRKIVLEEGKLVGGVILGDKSGVAAIEKLMNQKVGVTKYKEPILKNNFDIQKL